jgi:hypothetical protein
MTCNWHCCIWALEGNYEFRNTSKPQRLFVVCVALFEYIPILWHSETNYLSCLQIDSQRDFSTEPIQPQRLTNLHQDEALRHFSGE